MNTGPTIKRGRSRQDYETPFEFIKAVEQRFGKLALDVAASVDNKKAPNCITKEENSLTRSWASDGLFWCNPPFDHLEPWAAKCRFESMNGGRGFLLTPASIGADWFRMHVKNFAYVIALCPRLCFDGVGHYPKDCILSVFWGGINGFEVWRWK